MQVKESVVVPGSTPSDTRNRLRIPRIPRGGAKPKDRATLLREARALDELFLPKSTVPEKVLIQAELGYMRRMFLGPREAVDLTYPVHPPYAFVRIAFDAADASLLYTVYEPTLQAEEATKLTQIRTKMEATMAQEELPVAEHLTFEGSPQLREYLKGVFLSAIELYDIEVPNRRRPVLLYYLQREFIGLGRTDPILRDPFLEDISCLGPGTPLFVFHRVFGSLKTNVQYDGELELNKYVLKLAQVSGKHISVYQPILDSTLRDGSRINLTLGTEVTRKGSTFSIRKFAHDPISPTDILRFGSLSPLVLAFFWMLIEHHRSILISGGTASGKTTLLNAISMFIRPEDKIVSIEDTPEIHIDHENWIQSVARSGYGMASGASGIGGASGVSGVSGHGAKPLGSVTLFDLLVAALRQRPEYVIVGEVRGVESFTLFQAISVGHASMSTIHAGSIDELLHRVENEPMNIPRVLFQALDVVAFPAQITNQKGLVRRLTSLTEILEVDPVSNELLTNEVFRWKPETDLFEFLGRSFVFEKIGARTGTTVPALEIELRRKAEYLTLMDRRGISYYKDVSRAIRDYYNNPEAAMRQLGERTTAGP